MVRLRGLSAASGDRDLCADPEIIDGPNAILRVGSCLPLGGRGHSAQDVGTPASATGQDFFGVALQTLVDLETQGGDGAKGAAPEKDTFR